MNIFVVGATGATGISLVEQALARGHTVTAYVRRPERLSLKNPRLKVIQGELLDMGPRLEGHEAFLSTLGHTQLFEAKPYLSLAFEKILPALKESGIRRIVYESAYGVGETVADLPFFFRLVFKPLLLKHAYHDHELVEAQIQKSGLHWTIVRPTGLTNGPVTGKIIAAERLPKGSGSRISRGDVASYMLDALGQDETVGRAFGVTGL